MARAEREAHDDWLDGEVARVYAARYRVYGARKVRLQLRREGIGVARYFIEASLRRRGLQGARGGQVKRTTIADSQAARPGDLVRRVFKPVARDRLLVADFT